MLSAVRNVLFLSSLTEVGQFTAVNVILRDAHKEEDIRLTANICSLFFPNYFFLIYYELVVTGLLQGVG